MKVILSLIVIFSFTCCQPIRNKVVFDISSLVTMNIDQIRETHAANLMVKGDSGDVYKKSDITLYVRFNSVSREVKEFHLVSYYDYDKIEDLLKVGNLDSINPFYRLDTRPGERWIEGKFGSVLVYPER